MNTVCVLWIRWCRASSSSSSYMWNSSIQKLDGAIDKNHVEILHARASLSSFAFSQPPNRRSQNTTN